MKVLIVLCALACTAFGAIKKCGDEEFDNTDLMCCNGNITPRPDPNCVARVNNKCCATVGFDNSEYMCCDGVINARPDGYRANNKCCGQKAFDNLGNMCCRGVINARPGGDPALHQCCGKVAFSQADCRCRSEVLTCDARGSPSDATDEIFGLNIIVWLKKYCTVWPNEKGYCPKKNLAFRKLGVGEDGCYNAIFLLIAWKPAPIYLALTNKDKDKDNFIGPEGMVLANGNDELGVLYRVIGNTVSAM
ncbi:hypothetical protein CAPTEDRAFT_211529 [Capitella teleta]|uniref:Galaxin-like repeats domain-containing protein n=1 Tax=Capitella teleta TaxID=283909 RepID=R7TGJ0_CAPTE|nr:hypothetical protein CAPTEDRAFT_211529 [Capitella teleta]|eukprot:ELT90691.1 hypothetical protein CAPTEDRAFT_211529 [Capitella teleta]